jgi:GNAT superfamily N-acetyltransferase
MLCFWLTHVSGIYSLLGPGVHIVQLAENCSATQDSVAIGESRHGRACRWLDRVVNDPLQTSAVEAAMVQQYPTGASGLPLLFRTPAVEELPALSTLCFRSKAVWGYDHDFMEACRNELSIDPNELRSTSIAVAEDQGKFVGIAQVKVVGSEAELLKLFVEPTALRGGVGKALFIWATYTATIKGADHLVIEAAPDAAPFYRRMGAKDCGFAPSGSIAGRLLPKLVKDLQRA